MQITDKDNARNNSLHAAGGSSNANASYVRWRMVAKKLPATWDSLMYRTMPLAGVSCRSTRGDGSRGRSSWSGGYELLPETPWMGEPKRNQFRS